MKLGAHMSTSGGAWRALQRGRSINCEVVQVFVKNNMQWLGKPASPEKLALYANELSANTFSCVFGHTGYLINLGAAASEKRDRSIESLIQEIEFATALGLPFLVMHPGAHLGTGEIIGLKQIVAGLNEVFAATKRSPVRIALENTAGDGAWLRNKMGHLCAVFYGRRRPALLGIWPANPHPFSARDARSTRHCLAEPLHQ